MVMNMHKYDHTKGSKAFSYFSVVAKNYLILHNNNNYKKLKTHSEISTLTKQPTTNENKEIGKLLINNQNPFALIKFNSENFNFENSLKCGDAKIKIIKPEWL